MNIIKGFSKLTRQQKIDCIKANCQLPDYFERQLANYIHPDKQALFDDFSENTLSNYLLPFGVAPNFVINGKQYMVPMVTEESSVVAAASRAAAFWAKNGGFVAKVNDTEKIGQIWFQWAGEANTLFNIQEKLFEELKKATSATTQSMEKRGGGIIGMELLPQPELDAIWQLQIRFNTADSMGANFINSCLEEMKQPLLNFFANSSLPDPEILMAILSNHTPNCTVTCTVKCPISQLTPYSGGLEPSIFAQRFKLAVDIACLNTHRAVTHNKGIFNGIDAVVIATGNDFRAVEAAGHAYAARNGQYQSLSECNITSNGHFNFSLTIPLALGTVGGLTKLHPMSALAMEMLQNPSATELMGIAAAVGLANNFSAVASLVTTGIQKGHMKLHLSNILNSLNATDDEKIAAQLFFVDKTVSFKGVGEYLEEIRKAQAND